MKKYIIAALAAVAVFAISAFAASLQVDAGTLQAGDDAIDQCITDDVVVTYGAPTFTNPGWEVDQIMLDDASGNCDGLAFSVVVTSSSPAWATPAETGTFGAGPVTVTFDDAFDAEEATDVHIVIRSAA